MCYDLAFSTTIDSILDFLPNLIVDPQVKINFEGRYHLLAQGFPMYPVVISQEQGQYLTLFEWGVIASYMRTPEQIKKMRASMCNARSEKLFDKSAYWSKIRHQRCLIPAEGFYEHREIEGYGKKVPYFIKMANRKMFFIAGLFNYSPLADPETGEVKGTFAVITRPANKVMCQIHNGGENKHRMPMILSQDQLDRWIAADLTDQEMKSIIDYEITSEELEHWPVYTVRSKNPRPDGLPQNERFEWQNLPALGVDSVVSRGLF